MNELKFYLLMNHNHTTQNGAGCPVVFSDQRGTRAYTQPVPPRGNRALNRLRRGFSALWRAFGARMGDASHAAQ